MIRTGIDVTRFGRVATGVGGAAPARVPECAGPGHTVGVSNRKRRVGRVRGRAENNCRASGDAGAGRGRRRGGWTESEGVSLGGGGRTGVRVGGVGGGWRGGPGGGFRGLGGDGRALVGLNAPGRVVPTRAADVRLDGGWLGLVRCSPWSAGRRGGGVSQCGTAGARPDSDSLALVRHSPRSARRRGARDAGFKTSQGTACNVPGTAPRHIPAAVPASSADGCAAVRPTPGAGRANGAVWST